MQEDFVVIARHLALAIVVGGTFAAVPAQAQDQKYFFETQPAFENCGDGSFAKAQKDGITLGFSQNPPEAMLDEKTKQASGIDWEINKGALDWLGVKTIRTEWMPWESQVPALLSKRTDVIAGNIHVNPERVKVISFTGPAYWYGPVVLVPAGNPMGIKSYDDFKGKRVGSISGSAADFYLRKIGVTTTAFKTQIEELQSLRMTWSISNSPKPIRRTTCCRCGTSPRRRTSSTAAATAWRVLRSARRTARCAPPTPRPCPRCAPTAWSAPY
jgi:ABC-type amino acid transport substrate-binding protein